MKKTKSVVCKQTEYCAICGAPATQEHHLIFGAFGACRQLAEAHGLKIPICTNCHTAGLITTRIHDNPMAEKLSKMLGQAIFEREMAFKGADSDEAKAIFRQEFGKTYF